MSHKQKLVKRFFDLFSALLGLVLLWPLILLCIIVSGIELRESGLFRQRRVGQYGNLFWIYKIKTMKSTGRDDQAVTISSNTRIRKFGRLLRALKIDELPQLWNVVLGDMSLVGPRPDVPGYADNLTTNSSSILLLKPGVTGPASIKYRKEEEILNTYSDPKYVNDHYFYPDKVRINLEYQSNWTLLADIKYLLITFGLMRAPKKLATVVSVDPRELPE